MQNIMAEKLRIHKEGAAPLQISLKGLGLAAAAGAIFTGGNVGGALSPFGVSFTAAVPPVYGLAALLGSAVSSLPDGNLWNNAAELAAMTANVLFRYLFGKKCGRMSSALAASVFYFISICAFNAGGEWVIFAAALVRGFLCFAAALCFYGSAELMKNGLCGRNREVASRQTAAVSAVYIIMCASLCSYGVWIINPGRIAAGFVCCAAARKFGMRGAAAAGILSGAAFLLCDSSLGRCGVMLAFAAMTAGYYHSRGKYSVNAAFIISAFGITAAAGMPSGTPQFIADMTCAAVIYCLVPERLYLPKLDGICMHEPDKRSIFADRLSLAERMMEDVEKDVRNASELLNRLSQSSDKSISETVKSSVCGTVCAQHGCTAAGICGGADILDSCFRTAESIAQKEGQLTEKKLPSGFEGCTKKDKIAEGYNKAFGIRRIQARKNADMRRFLENATEQLSASCSMLSSLSDNHITDNCTDDMLSEAAALILEEEGIADCRVTVSFDNDMHPFCEAYFHGEKKYTDVMLMGATHKLSDLFGIDTEKPVLLSCGDGEDEMYCARWWGGAKFCADCYIDSVAAEGTVCGDSSTYFYDGLGALYIILADGMGKGCRAGAQSSMAVSILKRLILAGTGTESAVRTLNILLGAASSDETFTTADIMKIDLFTGNASLVKMGAAPTIVYTRSEDGSFRHDEYCDCSVPLGIIGRTGITEMHFSLDESSRLVMMTDGVSGEYSEYARRVMENDKLNCRQIASGIVDFADEEDSGKPDADRRRDDKTVAALRLYRVNE